MNSILILVFIICLVILTVFSIRREIRFNRMYNSIMAMCEQTDEKALEYVKYVTTAIKNKQKVLNYSAWNVDI
jgi:hypothetical protein